MHKVFGRDAVVEDVLRAMVFVFRGFYFYAAELFLECGKLPLFV